MLTSPWHIQMLGGLRLRREAQEIDRFRSHRTGALLAYLAYHARRAHPREELIELFWPEADIEAGRTSLRTALSSLRHQLEPPGTASGTVLVADRQSVQLRSEAINTDAAGFEAALTAAQQLSATERAEEKIQWLRQAINAYTGPLLPGYYEDWILGERTRLSEAYQHALFTLARNLQQFGQMDQAIDYARRALAPDALNEEAHLLLMELYRADNQPDAARQQYAVLEQILQSEMHMAPSPAAIALYQEICSGRFANANHAPTHLDTTRSAGAEGLPTASHSPAIAAGFTPGAVPPSGILTTPAAPSMPILPPVPSSASFSAPPLVRLPLQFTRFFGRESEREQLKALLQTALHSPPSAEFSNSSNASVLPENEFVSRLFTVTGMGGMGKTRLAVEVGRVLAAQNARRVVFVPLAEVTEGERLTRAIAAGLELPPGTEEAIAAQVAESLRAAPTLLILDNFEHLLHSGNSPQQEQTEQMEPIEISWPDNREEIPKEREDREREQEEAVEPAALTALTWLREQAQTLVLLITSRQRLNLPGKREFPLAPLPAPEYPGTVERLLEFASVGLFLDRARAARPDFQITPRNADDIAALCQSLDGIPLAIELMAAWAQTLTPFQMRQRLDERLRLLRSRRPGGITARHSGLCACIEWSYRLLSPELQRFFAQLAVFRGGWILEAAEAVCEESQALTYLTLLRECSLITANEQETESGSLMRYNLLETLREYAWEQVAETERLPLRIRHARYVTQWAESIYSLIEGAQKREWLQYIVAEQSNIQQAFQCFELCPEETATGIRLAAAVSIYWNRCGLLAQGRQTLALLLANSETLPPSVERGRVLLQAGNLAYNQGDYPASLAYQEAALTVGKQIADESVVSAALNNLGMAAMAVEDYEKAQSYYEESLQMEQQAGDRQTIFRTRSNLGTIAFYKGDYAAARALYEQSLAAAQEMQRGDHAAKEWGNIALVLCRQGQPRQALECHQKSLSGLREHNLRVAIALELESTAATLSALGKPDYAARLFGAAQTLRKTLGAPLPPSERAAYEENVTAVRNALPTAQFQRAWQEGTALSWEEAVAFALDCGEPPLCDFSAFSENPDIWSVQRLEEQS